MRTSLVNVVLATALVAVTGVAQGQGNAPAAGQGARPAQDIGPMLKFERVNLPGADFMPTMTEDAQGRMWFGTKFSGLVRFEGSKSTVFHHNPKDPKSLAFDYVEKVYIDRNGTLWAGTYGGGLDRFDPATETFTHYAHNPADPASLSQNNISNILEDRDGNFWVGTRGGLDLLDRATGKFTHFKADAANPNALSDNALRAMYQDRAGTIWFGTQSGVLHKFDPRTKTFTRYRPDPSDPTTLLPGLNGAILEDSRGRLIIGNGRETGGFSIMDREKGTFTRYPFNPTSSTWASTPAPNAPFNAGGVTSIFEDRKGNLWFGIWQGGYVAHLDTRTGVTTNYQVSKLDPTEPATHPFGITQSRDGTLWFASVYGPSYKLAPENQP